MYCYEENATSVHNDLKALKANIVVGVEQNVRQGLVTRAAGDEFLASLGLVSHEHALVEARRALAAFKADVDTAIEAQVSAGVIDGAKANTFRADLNIPTRDYDTPTPAA